MFQILRENRMKAIHFSTLLLLPFLVAPLFLIAQNAQAEAENKQKNPPAKTILFLGNSLTAGYELDPEQAYPALIQQKIDSLGWDFQVINAGLSGETSAGGMRRLNWLLKRRVDVLVLALGANDGLRGFSPKATEENLQEIIHRTRKKYPDVKIVIAGMEALPNMGELFVKEFRAIFPRLAERNRAALIPFLLEGVGGIPDLNLPDGVHPTAEGYRMVAKNVWKILAPVLTELHRGPAGKGETGGDAAH